MRGEIEAASNSLNMLKNLDGQVQRTRKQYQQGAEHVVKAQEKLQKAQADPAVNPKTKQTVSFFYFSFFTIFLPLCPTLLLPYLHVGTLCVNLIILCTMMKGSLSDNFTWWELNLTMFRLNVLLLLKVNEAKSWDEYR